MAESLGPGSDDRAAADPDRHIPDHVWEQIIDSWADPRITLKNEEHVTAEIRYHFLTGRRLKPGVPVPGCGCPDCTGVMVLPRIRQRTGKRVSAASLARARRVGILRAASLAGLNVSARGYAHCPFHDDDKPSLHINARKDRAFCNPCGRSWDSIALLMEVRGMTFMEAVNLLAGDTDV